MNQSLNRSPHRTKEKVGTGKGRPKWLSRSEGHFGPKQVLKIKGDVAFRERIKMFVKIKSKNKTKEQQDGGLETAGGSGLWSQRDFPVASCTDDLKWWESTDGHSFPHSELSPEPRAQHHAGYMCSAKAASMNG